MKTSLAARAAAVRLLVLDVDGVLTDGTLVYGPGGEDVKRFHVRDGYALVAARRAGLAVAVISGRASAAGTRRLPGRGAVREAVELILRARKAWPPPMSASS